MDHQGWIDRGALVPTASTVCPGSTDSWWLRFQRRQLQAWGWRRMLQHTRGPVELAVDLGCGYGDWAERLATIARRIVAVDVSPGFVAQTRARLAAYPAAHVACHDIRTFADYDGAGIVHLGGVLTYVDDADAAEVLSKARERLTRHGIVHTRDWCAINLGRASRQHRNGIDSVHRTPAQYVALARAAGLRVLEVRRAASILGEQLVPWLPSVVFRVATSYATRGSVSFLFARA